MTELCMFTVVFKEQDKDGRECLKVIAVDIEEAKRKIEKSYNVDIFLNIDETTVYM